MSKEQERQFFQADLRTVRRMLEETPEDDWINRMGAEFRLQAIEEKLRQLNEQPPELEAEQQQPNHEPGG